MGIKTIIEQSSVERGVFDSFHIRIMENPPISIGDAVSHAYAKFSFEGIYVITTPDDSTVVYVGMTEPRVQKKKENGIADRLWAHLDGSTCSKLRKRLAITKNEFKQFRVRAEAVSCPAYRKRLEHYAIAIFNPSGDLCHSESSVPKRKES